MIYSKQVHVVDQDFKRRAQIAYALADSSLRAQVYEDLCEFERFAPSSGFILLNGDSAENWLRELRDHLQARACYLPIAMYSSNPPTEKVVGAMLSGALDYLEWPFEPQRVRAALQRMAIRSAEIAASELKRADARDRIERLTAREREVLARMIDGFSNKTTAHDLSISPRTVEIHRSNVIRKLNVDSSVEAVRIGLYAGLDD